MEKDERGIQLDSKAGLNRDEMERRRLEAAQDLLNGISQSEVARKFGVSRTTASRWQREINGNGIDSLRKRRATCRPSRLTKIQLLALPALLAENPVAYGLPEEGGWTNAKLSVAIGIRFGVQYNRDNVGRIF